MLVPETIEIKGAREHNLQGVDLVLPKNQLIVFTGVSGSGKSSLAFDTLYAEGQRRYIESLSSYARQFLGQLAKPDVDSLSGLSPSISIEQKTGGANPRSTVGTITEIHDYLRVLFARVGRGHCPECDRPIEAQSREQILARLLRFSAGSDLMVLAPMIRGQKGEFRDFFDEQIRKGFVRARVDGQIHRLADRIPLDRQMRHSIEVVIDRLTLEERARPRLAEAVEQALALSDGSVVAVVDGSPPTELLLSSKYACTYCNVSFEPPSPQMFSFNSPRGMCPDCDGLGQRMTFDESLVVPDPSLSVRDGAIVLLGALRQAGRWRRHLIEGAARAIGFSLDVPWREVPLEAQRSFLHGTGDRPITFIWHSRGRKHYHGGAWDGIIPEALSKYKKTTNPMFRAMYEKYMRVLVCPSCRGARLNPQARHVRIAGKTLLEIEAMPVDALARFLDEEIAGSLSEVEQFIAGEALKEIRLRIGFLLNVGLRYLSLDRPATTLSGGEAQRIRLAGQIGSGLVGVLYVLDEPSIGLHPRDNARLLATLERLRDQGNTVLVVEHDEETMRAADYLVDFGPGPGVRGGEVVAQGSLSDLLAEPRSLTGQYLSGKAAIPVPAQRRPIERPEVKPAAPASASKRAPSKKTPARKGSPKKR